jgi:hypothetical protein
MGSTYIGDHRQALLVCHVKTDSSFVKGVK